MKNIKRALSEIDHLLRPLLLEYIKQTEEPEIIRIIEYCIGSKESFDRALFVRAGSEAVCGDWRKVLPAMAAAEMMDFSVITIDDILDDAPRRMERPTVHKKWGHKEAIIIASILKSAAVKALLEAAENCSLSKSNTRNLMIFLEEAHRKIYIGQHFDIMYEEEDIDIVTQDMYLNMIRYTTGEQVSACSKIGALLGGGNNEQIRKLGEYGLWAGVIYQIRDDLIDYLEDEHLTHKTPFLDLYQRKKRLPIILAYRDNPEVVGKILRKAEIRQTDRDQISTLVSSPSVIQPMRQLVNDLAGKALQDLTILPHPEAKQLLKDIITLGTDL